MNLQLFEVPAVITLQADNGNFFTRINRGDHDPIEAAQTSPDVFCRFLAEPVGNGKVTLRADNGTYLTRINHGDHDPIEAAAVTPDIFCQFAVSILADGKVTLQADNGKYLTRINHGDKDPIEAAAASPDFFCQFTVSAMISIKVDNNKYLTRINHGDKDPIEASAASPDGFAQFAVTTLGEGKITLRADNGKYLTRINRGDKDPIEAAAAAPDVFCQFKVTSLKNGNITLRADNGKYLTRINRGDQDPIEAAKTTPDAFCEFVVSLVRSWLTQEELVQAIQTYGPIVHFHPNEIYNMCSVEAFLQNATLCGKTGTTIRRPKVGQLPTGTTRDESYWLALDDSFKGGDLTTARAYVHAYWTPGVSYTDLQFWLFYAYNGPGTGHINILALDTIADSGDINTAPVGEHYGDWECCMVRLDNASKTPIGAWLSQHDTGEMFGLDDLGRFRRTGRQINVYSSRNGHAVYAQKGDNATLYWKFPEPAVPAGIEFYAKNSTDDGGKSLDCAKHYQIVSAAWLGAAYPEPQWVNYPYRWGPMSPTITPQKMVDIMLASAAFLSAAPEQLMAMLANYVLSRLQQEISGPSGPKTKDTWTAGYSFETSRAAAVGA
jgi:hypothetical protein